MQEQVAAAGYRPETGRAGDEQVRVAAVGPCRQEPAGRRLDSGDRIERAEKYRFVSGDIGERGNPETSRGDCQSLGSWSLPQRCNRTRSYIDPNKRALAGFAEGGGR